MKSTETNPARLKKLEEYDKLVAAADERRELAASLRDAEGRSASLESECRLRSLEVQRLSTELGAMRSRMQAAAQERERDERRKQKAAAKQPKVAGKAKAAPAEGGRSRLMSRLAPAEPPAGPSAAGCKKTIRKEPANKCR